MPIRRLRSSLVLAVAFAACGGPSGDEAASMPVDTLIKPMVREPLTESDLAGLTLAELALELPWTANRIVRDAAPGAPPTSVRSAEVGGHEGYDRVTFRFGDADPMPGYEISFVAAGATLPCGEQKVEVSAERSLVVTFRPARAGGDGETWVPVRTGSTGASRMSRAGVACDAGGVVLWVTDLARGDQVRVLELRNPGRIAIDVR